MDWRCTQVHGGPQAMWTLGAVVRDWRASAMGLQSSPMLAGMDDDEEAVPMRVSLWHGQWRRGDAVVAKSGSGSNST
jgi:hypothetical protein